MAYQQNQQGNKKEALKDYVEVNVRISKFWEKYPNGRISTELLSWENGVVIVKAFAFRDIADEVPSATGYAYEREDSSYINKTSALENCETSAVGRCLGILGFEIKKSVASKEEVENAISQQEKIKEKESKQSAKSKIDMIEQLHNAYTLAEGLETFDADKYQAFYEIQSKKFSDEQILYYLNKKAQLSKGGTK